MDALSAEPAPDFPQRAARRLHDERARLRQRIEALNQGIHPIAPDCALGALGRIEAMQSQSITHAELIAARTRIQEIEAAQARLARGNYGRCERCGEPIAAQRLEACPEARQCMACEGHRQHAIPSSPP